MCRATGCPHGVHMTFTRFVTACIYGATGQQPPTRSMLAARGLEAGQLPRCRNVAVPHLLIVAPAVHDLRRHVHEAACLPCSTSPLHNESTEHSSAHDSTVVFAGPWRQARYQPLLQLQAVAASHTEHSNARALCQSRHPPHISQPAVVQPFDFTKPYPSCHTSPPRRPRAPCRACGAAGSTPGCPAPPPPAASCACKRVQGSGFHIW